MKVDIYGKEMCPNCDTAFDLAKAENAEIKKYINGVDYTIPELFKLVGKRVAEFPQIFINDVYVGGLKEFKEFLVNDNSINENEELDDFDFGEGL